MEICAGAGGQPLDLENAGFQHVSLVGIVPAACQTLRFNRPTWHVTQGDLHHYSADTRIACYRCKLVYRNKSLT